MIEIAGTPIQRDFRDKERRLQRIIASHENSLVQKDRQILELKEKTELLERRVKELMVILRAARKKTRSRKIWKSKEAKEI